MMPISSVNPRIPKHRGTRAVFLALATVLVFSLLTPPLRPQNYLGQIGAPTFTTGLPVELGFLNASNGNLHLAVPLAEFPQRGGAPFTAGLVYDSSIWVEAGTVPPSWQPTNVPNSWGGWRLVVSASPGTVSYTGVSHLCDTPPPYHSYTTYGGFNWTAPDGTRHYFAGIMTELDPTNCDQGNITSGNAYATDSSGYQMYVTNYTTVSSVTAPDGTQVYPTVKDTNGNYFSVDGSGNVVDTLARTPITKTVNGNTITYAILTSQGSSSITVTTTSINISSQFNKSGVTEYSGTLTVIQKIILPDNTFYQFGYDGYGELNSITLPTGGSVTYGYSNYTDVFGNIGRWATSRVSGTGTWSYSPSVVASCGTEGPNCKQQVSVVRPSGDTTVYLFVLDNGGWNSQIQSYSGGVSSSNLLATSATSWNFANGCQGTGCTGNQNVQRMTQTLTLPLPGINGLTGGSATYTKQYTYLNITNSNISKIQEWKFYFGSPTGVPDRETDFTYLTNSGYTAKNITNRVLSIVVCTPTGNPLSCSGSTNIAAQTTFSYDQGTPASITSIIHHDDTNFGTGNTTRGNLTQVQRWASSTVSVSTSMAYDTTGQVIQETDPAANATSFAYTDAFYTDNGANPPQVFAPGQATNAYLTGITVPLIGKTSRGYYYNAGKLAFSADPSGASVYQHYVDIRDRLTNTYGPLVNGSRSWTLRSYTSSTQEDYYQAISDTQPSTSCTSCRHDRSSIDGLGYPTQRTLVNDPTGAVFINQTFDSSGRLQSVTNPFRTTSDPTYGTETRTYDGLNRVLATTFADGSVARNYYGPGILSGGGLASQLCASSAYGLGYPILSLDGAGKKRQTWRDGFGRTIEVDEPDSSNNLTLATCATFNLINGTLQTVRGGQTRSYTYDELSRITSVSTPEAGTTSFYYLTTAGAACAGDSSLVCRRTDAKAATITYSYDAANRLTAKTYSDSTPAIQYTYDQTSYNGLTITNGLGRLTGMSDGSGVTAWTYDPAGRIMTERRTINSITRNISYGYSVSGLVTSMTYPSGRVVTYSYNPAAQPVSVIDNSGSANYVTSALYAPTGVVSSAVYGKVNAGFAGITESFTFNNRLEPTRILASSANGTVIDLSYQFAISGGNNGNSASETNSRVLGRSISWNYDPLNRVSTAQSQDNSGANCWGLSFAYDALSNLQAESLTKCSAPILSLSLNSQNQITNTGYTYDADGRLTSDASDSYTWNAESQLTSANGVSYKFDGHGLRVQKSSGRLYWRDQSGDSIAETDLSGNTFDEYVFFGGRRIAHLNASGSIYYNFADRLGSTRVITNAVGSICYDSDYYPFGGELNFVGSCQPMYRFTGYERDAESGLDYALFRFYDSRTGRFISPDSVLGDVSDPESLNRYAYVENNPVNLVDIDGRYPQDQHEFITFFLATLLGLPGAQSIADGARDADSFLNATTGLFGLGYFINFSKHFGIPCNSTATCRDASSVGDDAYALGFQLHLVEDNSPGGPHDLLGSYSLTSRILDSLGHIFLNLIGKSPDTAAEKGAGFKAGYVVLGGRPGDYPQTVVEWFRDIANSNGLHFVGMEFVPASGDIVRGGYSDLSAAVEIARTTFSFQGLDYTVVLYWVPSGSFYDDPGVQAIMADGRLLGMSDLQISYAIYLYSNGLPPDSLPAFLVTPLKLIPY